MLASSCALACSDDGGGPNEDGGSDAGTPDADGSMGGSDGDTPSDDGGPTDGSTPADAGDAGSGMAPTYTPVAVEDFEEGADEEAAGWPATSGGPLAYDTEHARSGSTSIRIRFRHMETGYGGYRNLPDPVGPGQTVWYRVYLYLPSTLSLSYGDAVGDGFGWNKFMVMAELDHASPRMYVQPRSPYMVDYGESDFYGTGLYVNHDGLGDSYCRLQEDTYTFPRDRWFALQMAWKVENDATAWIRVWSDDELVGECEGAGQVPDGYEVQSWGIGDYWNGGAWIEGESTGDFWIDDVVVTTETPNTTDSAGRPFIHPDHF